MVVLAPAALVAAIVGSYSLLNTSITSPSGQLLPNNDYGDNPIGLIQYSKNGYMSATIAATEAEWRPLTGLSLPPQPDQSNDTWALVGQHSVGYAAPYNFVEGSTAEQGTVIHGPLTVATLPRGVGANQTRRYVVVEEAGKTLLGITYNQDNNTHRLWWEKVPSRKPLFV